MTDSTTEYTSDWDEFISPKSTLIWMPFSYLDKQSKYLEQETESRVLGRVEEKTLEANTKSDLAVARSRLVRFYLNPNYLTRVLPLLLISVEYPIADRLYPMMLTYHPTQQKHQVFSDIEAKHKLKEWLSSKTTTLIVQRMICDTNVYHQALQKETNEDNIRESTHHSI